MTRSDLLRVYDRSDRDIERDVMRGVLSRRPGVDPARITVTVDEGRVVLHGTVPRRSQIPPLLRDIRRVEGVVTATSRLGWETDDTLNPCIVQVLDHENEWYNVQLPNGQGTRMVHLHHLGVIRRAS